MSRSDQPITAEQLSEMKFTGAVVREVARIRALTTIVGQRYAINHLILFIAMFSTLLDFNRQEWMAVMIFHMFLSLFSKDDCRVLKFGVVGVFISTLYDNWR